MCGRFTQSHSWAEIVELYKLTERSAPALAPSWNVPPTHNAGVIVLDETSSRLQAMRWGLVPFWAKDPSIGSKLINARSETLAEKAAFRQALKSRRCVVPVSGFYEWRRLGKGKQPYFIARADGRPLTLAGLWERWGDLLTFTIITVPADETLSPIHDRMPAMLTPEGALEWLKAGDAAVLEASAPGSLAIWPVSTRVNSPANNDSRLVENTSSDAGSSDVGQSAGKPDQLALAL